MMQLPTRGRYALRLMIEIAKHDADENPISLAKIAQRTDISQSYLEQLAQALRVARLLKGFTGRKGGYRLARPADSISLTQIFEALIGPVRLVDCVDTPEGCERSEVCEARVVYTMINQKVTGVLEKYSLANLLDPNWIQDGQRNVQPAGADSEPYNARFGPFI